MRRNYQGSLAVGLWLALAGFAATAQAASYKVIHSFTTGTSPFSTLLNIGDKLFGVTLAGGDPACESGCGKVFFIIRGSNSPGDFS